MINKIRINNKTRGLKQYNEVLGLLGENKYETLRFTFDEFIDGFATLIVKKHDTQGNLQNYFINLTKEDESYTLEVQNSLLDVAEEITMQLIVENENRLIFKTLPFKMEVLEAMEAEQEIPEQYSTWSELLVQKFLQVDNKLAEVTTLEEDLENKRDTGYWKGEKGDTGEPGQDGTNGQDGYTPQKGIDYFTSEDIASLNIPAKTSQLQNDSGFLTNLTNNLVNYTLKTNTGSLIDLEINQTTYVVTLKLKDVDGNIISTDTIDLPLENVVVSGRYDNNTKKVILTLENGSEVDFSVADLVAGLQTEITSQNKLASDLVDDTNSGNKFVTSSEKQTWNNKLDSSDLTNYITNTDYVESGKAGIIRLSSGLGASNGYIYLTVYSYENYNDATNGLFIGKGTLENVITGKNLETGNNKVTTISSSSTNTEYPSAKAVYDYIQSLDGDEVSY